MKRLALIAATGFLALTLTGCGEHGNNKPATSTENTAAQPAVHAPAPANENNAAAPHQPAEGQH